MLTINLSCDAGDCCNSTEIEDDTNLEIHAAGYEIGPYGSHYCKRCWPIIKKEIERN